MVPVHFGVRAVTDEEHGFRSGRHFAAVLASVAFKIVILRLNRLRGIQARIGDSNWLRRTQKPIGRKAEQADGNQKRRNRTASRPGRSHWPLGSAAGCGRSGTLNSNSAHLAM